MTSVEPNDPAKELAASIYALPYSNESCKTSLTVDERVLARVTDGIYRRPSSALRELVANAYDADATEVVIQTDAPRFDRMIIRDNGQGMSPESLSYLIHHIGGSAKRTVYGTELAVTDPDDPTRSRKGRKLIGKIGIGLFAVSQITQHFQIITKRMGDEFKTSAEIVLKTHTEAALAGSKEVPFDTGDVVITKEKAEDPDSHGTEIILMDLRNNAKAILQSADRWAALDEARETAEAEHTDTIAITEPSYHIGRIGERGADGEVEYIVPAKLPWNEGECGDRAFQMLVDGLAEQASTKERSPNIDAAFDEYLATIWALSLSLPVPYLGRHPFQISGSEGIRVFELSSKKRGQVTEVELASNETVAERFDFKADTADPAGGFEVYVDGVQLFRPVNLDSELRVENAIGSPMLFVGKGKAFTGIDEGRGGGALEFEGYIYWNSRIIPKENNGVLVQINRASGVLFDQRFMDYQVSELTRLRQMTSEIFVHEGLDAALNIDRESFNYSHPHYQYVQKWLHRAIKQATNKLKNLNKERLEEKKAKIQQRQLTTLEQRAEDVWERRRPSEESPSVSLVEASEQGDLLARRRGAGEIVVQKTAVFEGFEVKPAELASAEEKVKALVRVLEAYGLLADLTYEDQQSLIADVSAIFLSDS